MRKKKVADVLIFLYFSVDVKDKIVPLKDNSE